MRSVSSSKFSVFSDGGVSSVEGLDFELIRIPGFGRPRDFRMTICDFRIEDGTTKHPNNEAWRFEVIRVPGFGRYRKPTVGIGRSEIFWLSDYQMIRLGPEEMEVSSFEWRVSNFECESRTVDVGNGRWMSLDDGEKIFGDPWSVFGRTGFCVRKRVGLGAGVGMLTVS
jgi:hypothetical protein